MTTICFDGYDLAADSLVTQGTMRAGFINKIIKLDNGGYCTYCGNVDAGRVFADWMNGKRDAPTEDQMRDSTVLYIDPKGKGWWYEGTASSCSPMSRNEAAGSGAPFAKAALLLGHTASEAIKIAVKLDVYSGGKVNVVHINKRKTSKSSQEEKK